MSGISSSAAHKAWSPTRRGRRTASLPCGWTFSSAHMGPAQVPRTLPLCFLCRCLLVACLVPQAVPQSRARTAPVPTIRLPTPNYNATTAARVHACSKGLWLAGNPALNLQDFPEFTKNNLMQTCATKVYLRCTSLHLPLSQHFLPGTAMCP